MATTRERREARAARLREWADKRAAKADAAHRQADTMADAIPLGQPILVGHYSEGRDRRYRDRIGRTYERAVEHGRKADDMRRRADNIEAAADRAIYSDDDDAVEKLRERVADLEAQRDRIKRYNAACRKAGESTAAALEILDERQRRALASTVAHAPYQVGKSGEYPKHGLANLSGQISKNRKRLAALEREGA